MINAINNHFPNFPFSQTFDISIAYLEKIQRIVFPILKPGILIFLTVSQPELSLAGIIIVSISAKLALSKIKNSLNNIELDFCQNSTLKKTYSAAHRLLNFFQSFRSWSFLFVISKFALAILYPHVAAFRINEELFLGLVLLTFHSIYQVLTARQILRSLETAEKIMFTKEYLTLIAKLHKELENLSEEEEAKQVALFFKDERRSEVTKASYEVKRMEWLTWASLELLHYKNDSREEQGLSDVKDFEILCSLSVFYELSSASVLTQKNCPPTLKNRFKLIGNLKSEFNLLSKAEKDEVLQAILESRENAFAIKIKAISYEMPSQLLHLFEQAEIDARKLFALSEFDFLSFIRLYIFQFKSTWAALSPIRTN